MWKCLLNLQFQEIREQICEHFCSIFFLISDETFKYPFILYFPLSKMYIGFLVFVLSAAKEKAFESVGYQIMFCQIAAVLEVIHPLLGLVKTGAFAPLLQVN